ncbi:nitrate reductase, partial [Serratia marcescens]
NVKTGDRAAYAQRVLDKGWLQRWPHLRQVKI